MPSDAPTISPSGSAGTSARERHAASANGTPRNAASNSLLVSPPCFIELFRRAAQPSSTRPEPDNQFNKHSHGERREDNHDQVSRGPGQAVYPLTEKKK